MDLQVTLEGSSLSLRPLQGTSYLNLALAQRLNLILC